MMKSKGFAVIPLVIIVGALAVGIIAFVVTKKNDSPVEQVAESVLRTQGIDIDFSPDDEDEQDYN